MDFEICCGKQTGNGDIVGIKLSRTSKFMVSLLGILKSGAAYLPLDTAHPQNRIEQILSDSNAKLCITEDDFADFLAEAKGSIKKISQDFISDVKFSGLEGTSFNYKGENINFSLCGKYNLKNALSVISLAEDLGLTPAQIKTGLETVKTIFGRNQ